MCRCQFVVFFFLLFSLFSHLILPHSPYPSFPVSLHSILVTLFHGVLSVGSCEPAPYPKGAFPLLLLDGAGSLQICGFRPQVRFPVVGELALVPAGAVAGDEELRAVIVLDGCKK